MIRILRCRTISVDQEPVMVMPPSGTFDYVATVPEGAHQDASGWLLRLRDPVDSRGVAVLDSRLVGYCPRLQVSDAGRFPASVAGTLPAERSRITLSATGRKHAQVSAVSFYVDRALISAL